MNNQKFKTDPGARAKMEQCALEMGVPVDRVLVSNITVFN